MSFLRRVLNFVLGNGSIDQEQHETEIRQKKAEIHKCNDETISNFQRAQKSFDEIELPEIPEDIHLECDEGGSHGRH